MNTPAEIAKNYLAVGEAKARLPLGRMLLLAVLAGMYIGLAGLGASVASAGAESAGAGRLLSACVFPAGLTMVLLAGSELFTGNCLMLIPVLEGRISPGAMLRNLLVVYLGNLAGGMLVAAVAVYSGTLRLFGNGLAAAAVSTAAAKCTLPAGQAFLRGAALFFPVFLFVLCGFEHCIANMYYIPAGLLALGAPSWAAVVSGIPAGLSWGGFLLGNLLPVTLGNLAGGLGLAAVYWAVYLRR